jgi:riboflavin transporter FmnP
MKGNKREMMDQKPASRKPIIFRKIRPRYKKALIPALIISFIIAVILLLILNKYFFKPIFEKKGSREIRTPVVAMKSQRVFQKGMIEAYTMFKV